MALEKSIFTPESLRTQLSARYGLSVQMAEPLPFGTANCYKIHSDKGAFFLKEFQQDFPEDALYRETELIKFLKQNGYPTAGILPCANGSLWFRCGGEDGRLVYLQEFIEGITYANNLPKHYLPQAAELLGQLHHLLRGYVLPKEMDDDWLMGYSPEQTEIQYDRLLTALETIPEDPQYEHIRADLLWKRRFAAKNAELRRYYAGITYTPSHGDYTSLQFLCSEKDIRAVIDFSRAAVLPAVWEIMRSYVQSCSACKNGAAFDTEEFCGYVARYLHYAPLTKTDLAAMPYVYLHQLARSRYGYKEYLISQTENRNELLQFAMWRTEICQEIDRKKDEISAALLKL